MPDSIAHVPKHCQAVTSIKENTDTKTILPAPIFAADFAQDFVKERVFPKAGSLVIVGGGIVSSEIYDAFLKKAGGYDKAKLVVIPTASSVFESNDLEVNLRNEDFIKGLWVQRGFKESNISVLHLAEEDVKEDIHASALDSANCIWISGGRQCSLRRYVGTPVEKSLINLLNRGGVIGGTSAGTAIMSSVMIADQVTSNAPIVDLGFSFIPFVILDQHFSKRFREERLDILIKSDPSNTPNFPKLPDAKKLEFSKYLGIGVDESTALLVDINNGKYAAEVIGADHVHFRYFENEDKYVQEKFNKADKSFIMIPELKVIKKTRE